MSPFEPLCASAVDVGRLATETSSRTSLTKEGPSYSVSTWDHDIQDWHVRDRRATKWQLRRWLRKLYDESWDSVSILIQRND